MDLSVPRKFVPEPYTYHQEIEVEIDSLSNLGDGVGRDGSWVVFVPFCLPGERVVARIYRNEKNCSHADLVEVLRRSPDRVEPGCKLFGVCGGCQYQHLSYSGQLDWKRQQVAELLQRMAGIDFAVNSPLVSPREFHYRSKLTPHFQRPKGQEIGPIGFLKRGRRQEIIDVPECPIATESINNALPEVRSELRARAKSFKKGATLLLRASADGEVLIDPKTVASERVGEFEFHFLAGDFFQNNPYILEKFVGYVRRMADGGGSRFLIDAYCGSGLFGISLAEEFERVIGVELSESSADWARHNARQNKIDNAEFLAATASAIFAEIEFPGEQSTVVIDPPRKGCDDEFLKQLFEFSPRRVVYISCNPATQIRDLKEFVAAGYALADVQPVDLFPQTRHLECVATLTRCQSGAEEDLESHGIT